MQTSDPLDVAVIVGSTREGRVGPVIARWFAGRAARRDDLVLDVIDLGELALPPVLTARRSPDAQAFADRIAAADAYVVVTPEYNHGYPAALKHAIDLCHREWRNKAAGFVSYGGMAGGLRAVEQLRQVFAELHVATVRDCVSFHLVGEQLDEHGSPRHPDAVDQAAQVMLDELLWWGRALRTARRADAPRTPATA